MRKIWAIALIAVHNAFRSRVVGVMLALLLLTIIGLPLTIEGDGTIIGYTRIMLQYTLGLAGIILAVATVWAGCASVASEIQGRQLQLVTTKPVHLIQIWIGKWLGLLLINGGLLAFCGLVMYGLLAWTFRPETLSEEENRILQEQVLVARDPIYPLPPPGLEEKARALAESRVAQGDLDPAIPMDEIFRAIRNDLLIKAYQVANQTSRQWIYHLPEHGLSGTSLLLQYRFTSSHVGPTPVTGQWRVTHAENHSPIYQATTTNVAHRTYSLSIPTTDLQAGDTVQVEYQNINTSPVTVVFAYKNGMQLLVDKGSFVMNLVRALLLMFFQLSLLGAIGLTAGTLFSMPVAALVSGYAIILLQAGNYIQRVAASQSILTFAASDSPTWLEVPLRILFNIMSLLVAPLQQPNHMELLADGRLLSWGLVGSTLLVKLVLYSGALAGLGSMVFAKREIALPST